MARLAEQNGRHLHAYMHVGEAMKKQPIYAMELVKWNDIVSYNDWKDEDWEFDPKDSVYRTIGFVIKEDDGWLILAGSLGSTEDNLFSEIVAIPVGCVISRRVVGELIVDSVELESEYSPSLIHRTRTNSS